MTKNMRVREIDWQFSLGSLWKFLSVLQLFYYLLGMSC